MDKAQNSKGNGPQLSIGALAQAADIPIATLRTWERRYGFPTPDRKPSGHRVYPLSFVARLRRVAEALARGYRAAEVLPASELELDQLLHANPVATVPSNRAAVDLVDPLHAVTQFDFAGLHRTLAADWARLGPVEFLENRVAPLIREVGDAWAAGRLKVAHEHFFSECLEDFLRTLRLPIAERADGPLVVLATLPDEQHALGLQMTALLLAVAGCRTRSFGPDLPVEEIADQAKSSRARAVAISVSLAHADRKSTAQLQRLRTLLPRKVTLLTGGSGAPSGLAGVKVFSTLEELHHWGRQLAFPTR